MVDRTDILWGQYQEQYNQGRHHESQRAIVTNLVMIIGAAILGVVTFDKDLTIEDLPLTSFLIIVGVFGAVFCAKHYERFRYHMQQAKAFRNELDKCIPESNIEELKKSAKEKHKSYFPLLSSLTLNRLWVTMHGIVALLGVITTLKIWY